MKFRKKYILKRLWFGFLLIFFFFFFFSALYCIPYKEPFSSSFNTGWKRKKKKKKIVPASKIFQLLCLLVLGKKRGSIHTILPDSELQEGSHCSCTTSPAQAEEGHLQNKLIHKSISIHSANLQLTSLAVCKFFSICPM